MFDNWTKDAKLKAFDKLAEDLIGEETKEDEEYFTISPIKNYLNEAIDRIAHPEKLYGLDTGYKYLNWITRGLAPQELIIIGGPTAEGKTQIIQSILLNIALNNIASLFITLEMPPAEITARLLEQYKSLGNDSEDIVPQLPIYFYSGDKTTLGTLEKAIEQAIKEHNVKIVAIDHLHFFLRSIENEASEIGVVTRQIKLMARKYNIPILLVSHIRKIYNSEIMPSLDDLRGSSFIAQDADTVIMIRRNLESANENERNIIKVAVRKNRRNGIIANFKLYNDPHHYLREMTNDQNPEI